MEPYIHYDIGEHAEKKKSRALCVATTACFYVCKIKTFNIKIAHRFPWMGLQSMELDNDRAVFIVSFSTGVAEYTFENCVEFATKVVRYVRTLLPSYHAATFSLPPVVEVPEPSQPPMAIVDLFLSQSILDKSPEYELALLLKRSLNGQRSIRIERGKFSESAVQSLFSALVYAPSIQSVSVCGKGIVDVWGKLVRVISFNHGITSLTLSQCKRGKGLNEFLDCLSWSTVGELHIKGMELDDATAGYLGERIRMTSLSVISFEKCMSKKYSVMRTVLPTFLQTSDCFENIRTIRIVKDRVTPGDMQTIMTLMTKSPVEKLGLVNCQMDLHLFFECMAQNAESITISELDLSANVCPKEFTGKYLLPGSLEFVKLKKVKWEGNSLLHLMGMHDFLSMLEIDVSQAVLTDAQVTQLLDLIPDEPPCQSIKGIRWCFNPLSVKLIQLFSKLKYLKTLSISHCYFPNMTSLESVVESLIDLLSKTNLRKFSIAGTLAPLKGSWMSQMQEVLSHHQTIQHLDISGNAIGDEGISVLREILQINSRISTINFDDQDLSSPDELIAFLRFLAKTESVHSVVEPKAEIRRLTDKTNKHKGHEMTRVWKDVAASKACVCDEETVATDLSTASIAYTESSPQLIEKSNPELTWDLELTIPYKDPIWAWEPLKTKYAYANLMRETGQSLPSSPAPDDDMEFE